MKCSVMDMVVIAFVLLSVIGHATPGKPKHFRHGVRWDTGRVHSHKNKVGYWDSQEYAKKGSNPGQR